MFVVPRTMPFGTKLTGAAARAVARDWWVALLDGAVLVVAGFVIFSVDWTVRGLATLIGVLFIVQGVAEALTTGIDARVHRARDPARLVAAAPRRGRGSARRAGARRPRRHACRHRHGRRVLGRRDRRHADRARVPDKGLPDRVDEAQAAVPASTERADVPDATPLPATGA
jgi:hypothetical protein